MLYAHSLKSLALTSSALCLMGSLALADQVILDDLIVDGSACIGFDCVNGESFGFDTIRIKENNLRIRAQDTSSSASFPSNDWQITFNDSANGGQNKFSIDDIDGGRTPFTIEAGAPTHSLYVDDGGRIGLGTNIPVVELHIPDGDTPTLRLEQNGSSGFTPQTWDVAGNETNFFIRDATNGSTLPFRIRPTAPSNSIFVETNGNVGLGTSAPSEPLHVRRTDGTAGILVEEASGTEAPRSLLDLRNNGNSFITLTDTSAGGGSWNIQNRGSDDNNELRITNNVGAGTEFTLSQTGDLTIAGGLVTGTAGSCESGTPCDRVFDPSVYTVATIADHAASMWENQYLPAVGPTLPNQPVNVTAKMLTMLNELEHAHIYIEQLHTSFTTAEAEIDQMSIRIEQLEQRLLATD